MARGDQLSRQWKLLQALIMSKHGKSVSDLATELECHPRSVYRDLEALELAGFPVYTEKSENKNMWFLLDTAKKLPIPFTLTELMAIYFSRNLLKPLKNTFFYESLESVFHKIRTTLPGDSRNYLDQIEKTVHVGFTPYVDNTQQNQLISDINDAALNKKYIQIQYFAMSRNTETKRIIAPYKLMFFNGIFYVIGYCCLRKDIRTFALDRIKSIQKTDQSFELNEDFDLDQFMNSSFGIYHGETQRVRIHFSAKVAEYIKEKIWHESQKIESLEDGSIIFEATVAGLDDIRFWVMTWGANAQVIEPKSLKESIVYELESLVEKYKKND